MTSSSSSRLDELILSVVKPNWRKVAMVVATVKNISESTDFATSHEAIAARIEALCKEGYLESQGDLSQWRHSEVRLHGNSTEQH